MKYFNLFVIMLFCSLVTFMACNNAADERKKAARDSLVVPETDNFNPNATPPAATTNANVPHYKCPNNCAGSGADGAGTCPVCKTAYVHNPAFHNQTQPTPPTSPTSPAAPAATPPITPEPAQNAAGVWHYTCAKGCAGGAGSAVACAGCGGTLTHNAGYHN